jgi:Ca-activated chloride channel family protein
VAFGLLLAAAQLAQASGKLYARFPNWESSPVFDLQLRKFTTTVEIQDRLAVVHVDETFYNDNSSTLEGLYFFEMPAGSKLTEMALWIDGQRVEHEIKRREEAVQQYEQIVRRSVDPLLAEEVGENVFRLRLFPLPPKSERRIEIKYIQPLPMEGDAIEFFFPLVLEGYGGNQVDSARVRIDLQTQTAIDTVWLGSQVPPFTTTIEALSETHYVVDFFKTDTAFEFDFLLRFRPASLSLVTALAFTRPNTVDDGYYMVWVRPPDRFFEQRTDSRQFVFAADVSASMIGPRLSQVKQALQYFVDQLQPEDRFNIVTFNTTVATLDTSLVPADSVHKVRAQEYIQTLTGNGLTDLNTALLTALAMIDTTGGPAQLLVISDGQPTWGETNTQTILDNVRQANVARAQIFPVGIGGDVDAEFFEELAQQNRATAFFIRETEEITERLVQIYAQITSPILTDVRLLYEGLTTYDTFPMQLPNLFKGGQFLQTGRYTLPGAGTLRFQASSGKTMVDTSVAVDWQVVPGSKYVSRYWAAQKILALLDDIERYGENPELVDAIVYLSITYSVLSPYTAFLVVEPAATGPAVSVEDRPQGPPQSFSLAQNYPNPFSPVGSSVHSGQAVTTIRYTLPQDLPAGSVWVELRIYNLLGQLVKVLVAREEAPGVYEVAWDGTNELGLVVPAGIYIVRMVAGEFVAERRLVVMR